MTKNETVELAKNNVTVHVDNIVMDPMMLRAHGDTNNFEAVATGIAGTALDFVRDHGVTGIHGPTFLEAGKAEALQLLRAAYEKLPEVVERHKAEAAKFADEWFVRRLNSENESAKGSLERFTENLATDPVYAFKWAEGAMKAAAMLKLTNECVAALNREDNPMTPTTLRAELERRVLSLARQYHSSTSATSNMMENFERVVTCEIMNIW